MYRQMGDLQSLLNEKNFNQRRLEMAVALRLSRGGSKKDLFLEL